MAKITRGEFLGFGAALAGGIAVGAVGAPRVSSLGEQTAPSPSTPGTADFIVINGKVYTSDPRQARAEAFAVKDGRFAAVGSTSDVRNLANSRT
jgi:hypothetical protein